MKYFLPLFFGILLFFDAYAQSKQTIYLFPGQGSDKRLFGTLQLDTAAFNIKIIEYGTPEKGMTMQSFAAQLSRQIDTNEAFILVGVSLGGMLCVELNEMLHPQKTILISSAKNRDEFPWRYRFQKFLPIYKLFPGSVLLVGAKMLQPLVEPDRNQYKTTFKGMLGDKNALFMKRTIPLILQWSRTTNTKPLVHIHGSKDHTLPVRNIKHPDYIIEKGSHMMTLTRGAEVSLVLNHIFKR